LEFLARQIRQEEEIKGTQIDKGIQIGQTIPVCRQLDFIPKRSKKILDTLSSFSKVAGYKIKLKN
jgi:hypothetical protein